MILIKKETISRYILYTIVSLLFILCHLVAIFSRFISLYPDAAWEEFLTSIAFALSLLMAYG